MPNIKYVCISDLHLGEEESLLTGTESLSPDGVYPPGRPPASGGPLMDNLVECLRTLSSLNGSGGQKPTLVLAGDIIDLALVYTNTTAMVLERFIGKIMPEKPEERLFKDIIFIPGNHDHHLWEVARETQYMEHISAFPAGATLPLPSHTTPIFKDQVSSYFINRLVRRLPGLEKEDVKVAYPNYGTLNEKTNRCVIFSHGHYIESLYHLISEFKALVYPEEGLPKTMEDLEAENFAWIDFFWSAMGRSGQAGKAIELVYEKIQDPEYRDEAVKSLAGRLAPALSKKLDIGFMQGSNFFGYRDKIEEWLIKKLITGSLTEFGGLEKHFHDKPLSGSSRKGLDTFIQTMLRQQMTSELNLGKIEFETSFIFGHTHKPFSETMKFEGFPGDVDVYNCGGWVVETVNAEPCHGGAIILVDEDLNTASVRVYNQDQKSVAAPARVEDAKGGSAANPLLERLKEIVDPSKPPFSQFTATAAKEIPVRGQNLLKRIRE